VAIIPVTTRILHLVTGDRFRVCLTGGGGNGGDGAAKKVEDGGFLAAASRHLKGKSLEEQIQWTVAVFEQLWTSDTAQAVREGLARDNARFTAQELKDAYILVAVRSLESADCPIPPKVYKWFLECMEEEEDDDDDEDNHEEEKEEGGRRRRRSRSRSRSPVN
jgi:hypothetical protein